MHPKSMIYYQNFVFLWTDFETSGTSFWGHEWDKHGACSTFKEHDYFSNTLTLRKHIDIMNYLKQVGIIPSNTTSYSTTSISQAIISKIKVTPLLTCKKLQAKVTIAGLYLCVNKALQLFECNDTIKRKIQDLGGCINSIYMLPLH